MKIKCSLAGLVTGRLVSVFAPSCRIRAARSRACVSLFCDFAWIGFRRNVLVQPYITPQDDPIGALMHYNLERAKNSWCDKMGRTNLDFHVHIACGRRCIRQLS